MATRRTPPGARSPTMSSPPTSIVNGATARSAMSPRNSLKSPTTRNMQRGLSLNGDHTVESLTDLLWRETDQKEQLLVQLQNKEQTISEMTAENDHLHSALNAAESRLAELYADQTRSEEETATRMEVSEKLRTQMRETEKERRDLQRRYNEQTSTFDAERQAFYDNEQHLKSRIQTLSQALNHARKQQTAPSPSIHTISEIDTDVEEDDDPDTPAASKMPTQSLTDPEQEPVEITSLKLELSTLSTSYSSLQNSIFLLQSQLLDVKRVNNELQEENESYMILLREKTLSGQYDVMRQVGVTGTSSSASDDDDEGVDGGSLHSSRSLGTVDEEEEDHLDYEFEREHDLDHSLANELELSEAHHRQGSGYRQKRGGSKSHSPNAQKGESLAGLPITGPGLDLAAELGRAENKDILSGVTEPSAGSFDVHPPQDKHKRGRKSISSANGGHKVTSLASELAASTGKSDVETLRNEVKSLKDANKALSLYASKIIDRIIAQEGFEQVLSVDYEKPSTTPSAGASFQPALPSAVFDAEKATQKPRPQSAFFGFASTATPMASPAPEKLTTFESNQATSPLPPDLPPKNSTAAVGATKRDRRSFSLDWSSFSLFSGDKKPADAPTNTNPNLRPLTLKPGATALMSPSLMSPPPTSVPFNTARKLETVEDEDDRKERERLAATMKLMGIEKPSGPVQPAPLLKSHSSPIDAQLMTPTEARPPLTTHNSTGGSAAPSKRWSFFRARSATTAGTSDTSSFHSGNQSGTNSPRPGSINPANLTQEALAEAEAEQKLAALDAHEKMLSEQLARGGSSGFTEPVRRSSRRGRLSANGSGSTVWSAGMSKGDSDE